MLSNMRANLELPPEFQRALRLISIHFETAPVLSISKLQDTPVCIHGNVFLFDGSFKSSKIPARPGWKWNQTKGRRTGVLPRHDAVVEFYKLIPRKTIRSSLQRLPSMKLWQFNIKLSNDRRVTMVWCEKGEKYSASKQEVPLCIDDFEFLSPFMSADVVREIWPQSFCNKVVI